MIYLTEGNTPLNEAYNDEIVQERNNTYQLTFRFPTSDPKWELLKEETFLTADDLHGEQDFYIFEVEKQQGYIQVYANQVISLLNNYIVSSIDVDRVSGTRVLSALAGSITRTNPFSFFSDIDDRHTLNIKDKNAMEVLAKDKHSILGQWGGDMVRNGYNLRLLKNGGSENESLFMYKKNLSSYQHKISTKSLKTRITFKTTVKGEGEKAVDHDYVVVIDSPLLGKYSQIYEAVVEVNDQNVKDQASLIEYGKRYFRTSMCDMLEDNLEISVVGQSDVAVRMFDVVSIYHEWYGLDVRKKITKYTYSPMAKRLKSIGFGTFQSSLANAIGGIVNDAVLNESRNLHKIFEERLKKEIANADRAFDAEFAKREKAITDDIELAKAKAEEVKQELSDTINQRFDSFDNGPLKEAKRKAEEALKNAGASNLLANEAQQIAFDIATKFETFKDQSYLDKSAVLNNLYTLRQTVTSEVNQASEYRRTTEEALSRMTGQMDGFATKSEVRQDVTGLTETFAKLKTDTNNLISGAKSEITLAKTEFQKTADGLSAKMSAIETYVGQDSQRQEALQRYTREESAKQATAVRELVAKDYVGKATYQETVRAIENKFEAITNPQNGSIATQIANYKKSVDGRFTDITSLIAGKANQIDFQRVKETSQLYERIIGSNENDISNKVARMALTNQLFQVEVSKYSGNGVNRALNTTSDWGPFISRSGGNGTNLHADLHKILSSGFKAGDTVHVRMEISIDDVQRFNDKQIVAILQSYGDVTNWARAGRTFDYNIGTLQPGNNWRLIEFDTVMTEEMLKNNGWMLNLRVDGASSYKVHTKTVKVEKGNVASVWNPAPEDTDEAVRSVQSQLAGSWAVQNINNAGDLISGINLGATGHNRITGKLTHITGDTLIDNAVIKSAMIDKLKTANFEAGSVTTTILDAEAVTAEKLKVDNALIRKITANDAFIDQLTSKRIFTTRIESVISSSTFLEAYQGRIGGFTIGHFDQGRGRWISGVNQFSVGMGNGEGGSYNGQNTAFWANWGHNWNYPGPNAWYVTTSGNMYCRNGADFHGKVDFSDRSRVNFYSQPSFSKGAVINGNLQVSGRITYSGGEWLYSPTYNKLWKDNSQGGEWLYLDRQGNSGRDWIQMNKQISDRRYKSNIQDSPVSGLDVIEKLKTYSYRKEYDGKIEDISCGIMAQDVQKYVPEAFYENPDGAYSYRTFELVPYLIKAIQELNQKIEKMEKTIA